MTDFKKLLIAVIGLACAVSVGCGGGSSGSSTKTTVITQSGSNVAPIVVNSGPANFYVNGAFASVTVCVPGTSTCQTIDGVLVDTGSSGLRILSSALTIALPQQKAASGSPVVECLQFLGSYTWGPVQTADVQIAGEKAASAPIQVLSDTDFAAPSACSNGFPSANTLDTLGANGILGIGSATQDCGSSSGCGLYYECPSTGSCTTTTEALAQQVINPVALFPTDNNGVIVELPTVSGSEATVNGSLVFGIGTQSNNGLGSATIFTIDKTFSFSVDYKGTFYGGSFIDSGSNGYFFLDSSIVPALTDCSSTSGVAGFYCPSTTQNFSATNEGLNGTTGTVDFSIANAQSLFANTSDTAFSELGGPSILSGPDSSAYFDWGLPFFYGRNVYTAIEGKSTPGGTGPYWAY
jgi:uncharacterized protein DUF3443